MERKRPKDQLVIPTPDQAKAAGLPRDVIEQMENPTGGFLPYTAKRIESLLKEFAPRGIEYPQPEPVHKLSVDERKLRREKNRLGRERRAQGRTAAQVGTKKWRARAKRIQKVKRMAGVDHKTAKDAVRAADKIELEMVQMLERHHVFS